MHTPPSPPRSRHPCPPRGRCSSPAARLAAPTLALQRVGAWRIIDEAVMYSALSSLTLGIVCSPLGLSNDRNGDIYSSLMSANSYPHFLS